MSHSRPIYDVHEGETGKYTVQLADENKVALDITIVESLELTLYDTKTDEIVNSRIDQDVLNTNGVTLDCEGVLTWAWDEADMPLLTETKDEEIHVAVFHVRWGTTKHKPHEIAFRVHRVHEPEVS